jgi:hypothetical protein
MEPVTDLRDTRVLIPRARRAIEGPDAIVGSAGVPAGNMTDEQVNSMVADAIASVILLSGGLFGKELEVASRDEFYMAPDAWLTSQELTEPEQMVIAYQAALDYYMNVLEGMKVSERIQDEGQLWEYGISSTVLNKRLEALRADRDRALSLLDPDFVAEDWINLLLERDRYTDQLIEPWVAGGIGGQVMGP